MTYHDNDVYFSLSKGYKLISGSYTVDSYSITSGQDPKGHIYPGLIAPCGKDGKMTFSVGRSGSGTGKDGVAKWFNDRVPASQNTYNITLQSLNFAFLGTLKLTITGGILGGGQGTFSFPNVALAQGKNGFNNLWWFGGQNCSYIKDYQVICQGVNSKGAVVFFVFERISSDSNTILVTPTTLMDTANWMKGISDSVTMNQVMMPGSHDAGMSELHHCSVPIFGDPYTQTQSGSVGQQLVNGSRYFDIRVDYDHDTLVTYHRTDGGTGCNGQDLQDVLDQAQAFLIAHPTETAILMFSHIRKSDGHNAADTKRRINILLNDYRDSIYTNSSASINLAEVALGSTRGKMILVFDYSEHIDTATGRFRFRNSSYVSSGTNLAVYDRYADTSSYSKMKTDQLEKWKEYGGLDQEYLFLLSWTLTPGSLSGVATLAAGANKNLPGVLYDQIVKAGAAKPNIVYIDYVNAEVSASIIQYNF